tara:strand:+ start:938 stop:1726 length:789 start_codon:yes stop_codon:yes gene_type:complete
MLAEIYIIYAVVILPIIILMSYVYKKDLYPEDKQEVFITFLLGASTVLFLDFIIPLVEVIKETFFTGLGKEFFYAFFRAATLEESLKFLVLYYYASHLKNFNEPMDAVVFATAASLGFAAIENVDYVFLTTESSTEAFGVAFARAFSAVPLHGLNGVIMGLFFGLALFNEKDNEKYLFLALAVPIFIHGLYNFVLSINIGILIYVILIVLFYRTSNIFDQLRLEQHSKGSEIWDRNYVIVPSDIYTNILKISAVIVFVSLII